MVVLAALVVASLWYYIEYPGVGPPTTRNANFGFGPDWDCKYVGKGDPICVKKQPAN
jgi:hypothetical protein